MAEIGGFLNLSNPMAKGMARLYVFGICELVRKWGWLLIVVF